MRVLAGMVLGLSLAIASTLFADEPAAGNLITLPLFRGGDLSGWDLRDPKLRDKSRWEMVGGVKLKEGAPESFEVEKGEGVILNAGKGVDLVSTEAIVGDCELQGEFNIAKNSNSGIYFMGQYELQLLDSYGKADKELTPHDCGAVYNTAAPKTNATKPAGEWQTFEVTFRAPQFDAKYKKTANAKFVKVVLNGKVIQENVEVKGPTPGALPGLEKPKGPFMLQGDHGAVAFQNLKVKVELRPARPSGGK
jgi:hypothetical protein